MAKFILENGNTESYDNIKEENLHKVSPTLMVEMRFIDTLKKISTNLKDPKLNNGCIMELINGSKVPSEQCMGDCDKCIAHWYIREG